jgi:mannitol-1-phosphate/altronate dehydrogenase
LSKAEEYQTNAIEADRQADQATDAEFKRLLRATATNWRELAYLMRRRDIRIVFSATTTQAGNLGKYSRSAKR